jgi:tetratricopeptide (TPR) repeat protein
MTAAFNTAVAYGKIGDVLLIDGKVKQAIPAYAEGVRASARLAESNPHNQSTQQEYFTSLVELGHALVEGGRMDEGMRYVRDGMSRMQADSTDTPLARSVQGLIRSWYGEALERQGKVREAAREYATVKERLGAVRNPDPRLQGFYAAATDRLAATYGKLGDVERATREYEESRKLLEPLVQAHPRSYELVYVLAETYTAEGDIAAARAQHAPARAEKLTDWQTGRSWYEKSLTTWGAVPHPTWISTSGFEVTVPAEVSRRRARCEREIKALAR